MNAPLPSGLTRRQAAGLFAAALAVLLLSALPRPFSWPTYWDGSLGPMTQALWLHEHGFDYPTLVREVPGYAFGGPKVYLFSIWPPLVAALMRLLDAPAAVLAALHAVQYMLAAAAVVVAADLARRRLPALPLWVAPALLLSQPFFLSQAAAVNMEMPVLLASLLALRAYQRENWNGAALWLLAGFAVKQSVTPLALALGAAFTVARLRRARDLGTVIALVATPLLTYILGFWESAHSHLPAGDGTALVLDRLADPLAVLALNLQALVRTPDLMLAALAVLAAALFSALRARHAPRPRAALEFPTLALAGVALLLAFNTLLRIPLPRYVFSFAPLLLVCALELAAGLPARRLALGAAAWSAFQLAGLHGLWPRLLDGPDGEHKAQNGYILERSLECRADLELQLEVFRTLERSYPDRTVVATWPLLHHAMRPGYGYVSRGFPAMASHRPGMQWAGAQSFWEFRKAHPDGGGRSPADFIWIWTDNVFGYPKPPMENLRVLKVVEVAGRRATLFDYTDWPPLPAWAMPPVR